MCCLPLSPCIEAAFIAKRRLGFVTTFLPAMWLVIGQKMVKKWLKNVAAYDHR